MSPPRSCWRRSAAAAGTPSPPGPGRRTTRSPTPWACRPSSSSRLSCCRRASSPSSCTRTPMSAGRCCRSCSAPTGSVPSRPGWPSGARRPGTRSRRRIRHWPRSPRWSRRRPAPPSRVCPWPAPAFPVRLCPAQPTAQDRPPAGRCARGRGGIRPRRRRPGRRRRPAGTGRGPRRRGRHPGPGRRQGRRAALLARGDELQAGAPERDALRKETDGARRAAEIAKVFDDAEQAEAHLANSRDAEAGARAAAAPAGLRTQPAPRTSGRRSSSGASTLGS